MVNLRIAFINLKMTKKIKKLYKNAIIIKSQVEIRLSNIDQAKEFLKKNPNCNSQILSITKLCLSIK